MEMEYRFNVGDVSNIPSLGAAIDIHMPDGSLFRGLMLTDISYVRHGTHWEVTYRGTIGEGIVVEANPRDRIRKIIASRCAPAFHCKRRSAPLPEDQRETRARETLRRVVGERRYRDFLRSGFVSLKAASGLTYQVFPGGAFTKVYDQGKLVDRLCVVLEGRFPPTDSIIMRYLLLANDEQLFRRKAIKQGAWMDTPTTEQPADTRPLTDLYREMKAKAHAPQA